MIETEPLRNAKKIINIDTIDEFLEASGITIKEKFLSRSNKIILASILKTPPNETLENKVNKLKGLKVITQQDVEKIIENYKHQNFLSKDDAWLGAEGSVVNPQTKTLFSFPKEKLSPAPYIAPPPEEKFLQDLRKNYKTPS